MQPVLLILVSSLFVAGCGKKRILHEAGEISVLANDSVDLAMAISARSQDPVVISHAAEIIADQEEIIDRTHRVTLATVDVEDRADDISAWWGDMFMGTIQNVKWLAILGVLGVIAFVGYRAKVWSLIGRFLGRG